MSSSPKPKSNKKAAAGLSKPLQQASSGLQLALDSWAEASQVAEKKIHDEELKLKDVQRLLRDLQDKISELS
jgi:hypothetical protein